MIYETKKMTFHESQTFLRWFEKNIGTECERNKDDDKHYFIIGDLTPKEVAKIRNYENNNI